MNDTDKPHEVTAAVDDWAAQAKAHEARGQAVFAENRAALFDALERSGIEAVTVVFDGYGDSGQIEDVDVTGGTAEHIAATRITQQEPAWRQDTIETLAVSPRTAIENLCYALLERTHGGWENNEGGYGEFVFDVGARTITLEFNQRYEATEFYSHEF